MVNQGSLQIDDEEREKDRSSQQIQEMLKIETIPSPNNNPFLSPQWKKKFEDDSIGQARRHQRPVRRAPIIGGQLDRSEARNAG